MCVRKRKREGGREGERGETCTAREEGMQREHKRKGGERKEEKRTVSAHISADITDCPLIILYAQSFISRHSTCHHLLALRQGEVEGVMRSKTRAEGYDGSIG